MNFFIFIRSLLATILFVILTMLFSILGFFGNIIINKKKFDDWVISTWAHWACVIHGVEVKVFGKEKIPNKGCLFLFNHSSFFDVFALAATFTDIRFGAKSELFRIPLFGIAMRRAGTLPIARNNREEVFKIYKDAEVRFAAGERFALSPEGGRFYGSDLASFKSGPFIFAMSAQVPLVPVIIKGAYECLPKGAFIANLGQWKRQIQIEVLDPIETSGYQLQQRHDLQKLTYEKMNQAWKQPIH